MSAGEQSNQVYIVVHIICSILCLEAGSSYCHILDSVINQASYLTAAKQRYVQLYI
jgi:hypothetical protein